MLIDSDREILNGAVEVVRQLLEHSAAGHLHGELAVPYRRIAERWESLARDNAHDLVAFARVRVDA